MTTNYTKELTGQELADYLAVRFPKATPAVEVQAVEEVRPSSCRASASTENQAFFYVDGIPTKGAWIDLDMVGAWEDIQEELSKLYPSSDFDEVLCADVEGLAKYFYASNCDSFDLSAWLEFQDDKRGTHLDDEILGAYFDNCGVCPVSDVEEAYCGAFDSDEDFAIEMLESCGDLDPNSTLANYFDYEKYARDLMFDFFESDGHYFRNC